MKAYSYNTDSFSKVRYILKTSHWVFFSVIIYYFLKHLWVSAAIKKKRKSIYVFEFKGPSKQQITHYVSAHRGKILDLVDKQMAVIIRTGGFNALDDFENIITALKLVSNQFPGTVPRKKMGRNFYVNATTEFSSDAKSFKKRKFIPFFFHNENAYFTSSDGSQSDICVFCSLVNPDQYGHTLLVDGEHLNVCYKLPFCYKYNFLSRREKHKTIRNQKLTYLKYTQGYSSQDQYQFKEWKSDFIRFSQTLNIDYEIHNGVHRLWSKPIHFTQYDKEGNSFSYANFLEIYKNGYVSDDGKRYKKLRPMKMLRWMFNAWISSDFVAWQQGDILLFNNKKVMHSSSYFVGRRNIIAAFMNWRMNE